MFCLSHSYPATSLSNILIISGVVFIYRVYSVSLIPIEMPVCPAYELLQVLFLCTVYVLYVSFLSSYQSVQRMSYCRFCFYVWCILCMSHFYRLPVCPTYELLQVSHFISYIPLEFVLFWVLLSLGCLYMPFVARKAMFMSVCVIRSVILCTSGL